MNTARVVLVLGLALSSRALSADAVAVTLGEALALAGQANLELRAASARGDALAARAESVRRLRRPRLGLSTSWSRTNLPAGVFANRLNAGQFELTDFDVITLNDPDALDHLGTNLSLEVPLDVFGKLGNVANAIAAEAQAASAGTRDAAQELRLRVTEVYRQAEMAARAAFVTERTAGVAKAREAEIEARVETGGALHADLLRARARRREREADLAERRGQERMALARLARLLDAPAGTSYVPVERPKTVTPLEGDELAWVERALRQRAGLEMARRMAAAAAAFVKHESNGRLPDAFAFGQLWDDRIEPHKGNQSWAVGVGIRWMPFDPARGKRKAVAIAEQRAATFDEQAATDQVRLEVALAYRLALSTRERHAAAAGGSEEGREALRIVQQRRQAGMATLTDELETEAAALGAALQEIRAAAEVAIADAALRRAAGEI